MSPYRATVSQTELLAETAVGQVTLTLGPKSTKLEVGPRTWSIADDHLVVTTRPKKGKRKPKKRSIRLGDSRLFVAHAWPTNEVSLWVERKSGVVQRLLGLPPLPGMSESVMKAWKELEKLAGNLEQALADYGDGARASELGSGQNRVLVLRYPDKLVVYARKVFREKPSRIIELREDGSLALPGRTKDRVIPMDRGMEVIASGDRISFCHPDGEHVAGVFLPWIGAADRVELTRRFQSLVATTPR